MNWDALRAAGCTVRLNALLADYTTFRLGGPCPALVACTTLEQLTLVVGTLQAAQQEFVLIGGGSNLLVADQGLAQVVIRYVSDQPHIRRDGNIVSVSGSTLFDDLIAWTVEEGLDGLVYASGIPGTVGGAVAGNAGAFGRQIGDVIETAVILDPAGQTQIVPAGELGFAYRRSRLQATGEIVAFDTSGPEGRAFATESRRQAEAREALFRRLSLDAIAVSTDRPYRPALTTFFEARARRLRH